MNCYAVIYGHAKVVRDDKERVVRLVSYMRRVQATIGGGAAMSASSNFFAAILVSNKIKKKVDILLHIVMEHRPATCKIICVYCVNKHTSTELSQ